MVTDSRIGEDPPGLTLGGSLPDQAGEELVDEEIYTLDVDASDGSSVEAVDLLVERRLHDSEEPECDDGTCGNASFSFEDLDSGAFAPGERIVSVTATDDSGETRTKRFRVGVPPKPRPEEAGPEPPSDDELLTADAGATGATAFASAEGRERPDLFVPLDFSACHERFGRDSGLCDPEDAIAPGPRAVPATFDPSTLSTAEGDGSSAFRLSTVASPIEDAAADIVYGIGGEQNVNYTTGVFPQGVNTVKRIVPWNIMSDRDALTGAPGRELARWDFFYRCNRGALPDAEECENLNRQIVVAFRTEAPGTGDRPPINDYVNQIRAFRDAYPEVIAYSAWNEPNHPDQPFDSARRDSGDNEHHYGPRWAALYTHYAQRTLCFNDCAIIAADLAQGRVRDNDRVIQYLRDYRKALVRRNGSNRPLPTV